MGGLTSTGWAIGHVGFNFTTLKYSVSEKENHSKSNVIQKNTEYGVGCEWLCGTGWVVKGLGIGDVGVGRA